MVYQNNYWGHIVRVSDGATIPNDPRNIDYQEFESWLDAGNTVAPYVPPLPTWADIQAQAKSQLDDSDTSMHRVTEAVVMDESTLTTPDVVTFIQWRRALRTIVQTESGDPTIPLPIKPPYPAHT